MLLLRLWVMLLRVVELGPATRRAVGQFGAAVEAVTPRKRREETGTIVSVTRAGNERVIAARVRVGDQLVDVPWNGAGAREGDVVMLSRALGSAAAPDWTFERFADSLSAYPVADDNADIPPPLFVNPFVTTTMLTAAAQQGAQVTVHLTETPAAYGPASIEVQWRRTGTGESWRRLVIADQAGVDAAIQAVLPELLEPGAAYDFRARTTTVGGATSPYGDLLTRTLDPAIPAPNQPPPFVAPPTVPYIDVSGNVEMVIHYPPPNQPTTYDYWQTEIATAAGGPTVYTLNHYGAIGNFKAPSAGSYFVRYREVSKYSSGGARVASPWQPLTGYAGPFALALGPGFDTTPPAPPTDLSVPVNTYVVVSGLSQQQVRFGWNGEGGVVNTYPYSADFSHFELRIEDLVDLATVAFRATDRRATYTAVNELMPNRAHRMSVRAWDRTGNATAWTVGPTFTTPQPVAPSGATTLTIEAMGSNSAALRIAFAPATALQVAPVGFLLHSTPTGYLEPRPTTFIPAGVTDTNGAVSVFHIVAPVTTDPPPSPPLPAGTKLLGLSWTFWAEPVSALGGIGASSAQVAGVFTAIDGFNLIVNSVAANRLESALLFVNQYIQLKGGAYIRSDDDHVRMEQTRFRVESATAPATVYATMDATGINVRGGMLILRDDGNNVAGVLMGGPSVPVGPLFRLDGGQLQIENYAGGAGGLKMNRVDGYQGSPTWGAGEWNTTPTFQYGDVMKVQAPNQGFRSAGRFVPIPASVSGGSWSAAVANTDYVLTPSAISTYIPTGGCLAWVIRGFFNAPAGTRLYLVSNPAAWSYESGGSIVVPPGAGAVDFGPWVISNVGTNTIVARWTAATTGGQFWLTGFFM